MLWLSAKALIHLLLSNFDLADGFVKSVIPPVVRELLGRVVAHSGCVELEVGPDWLGDTLTALS